MVAATNTFGTAPLLYKLDFDPMKAFAPVATAVVDKQVMVVAPSLPVKTVQELVAYAKANPGKLNYGSAIGIGPHFVAELFKIKTGTDIVHVPYRGGAPMITDLLAGQIQMTVNGKSVLLPHIQAGKMRAARGHPARSAGRNCRTCRRWSRSAISMRPTTRCSASSRRPARRRR